MSHRRVTLKHIADSAGKSVSTVSRALRGDAKISQETRRLVTAKAIELNYPFIPDDAVAVDGVDDEAENTKLPGVTRIALIIREEHVQRFFSETVMALMEIGNRRGFSCLPIQSKESEPLPEAVNRVEADAIFVFSMEGMDRSVGLSLKDYPVPIIFINRYVDGYFSAVTLDDFAAGFASAQYLLELGHRRIAYLSGDPLRSTMRERTMGFRAALELEECYEPRYFSKPIGFNYMDEVSDHVRKLLTMKPRPTAIAAYNDLLAVTAVLSLRNSGLDVPGDISVIGFDNDPQFRSSQLTTFDYRWTDIADHAIYLLEGQLRSKIRPPARISLFPHFVQGITSGAPPAGW